MNLENFPTSEAARRMMETVSGGFYDKSYVGKWIYQVMGMEWDEVRLRIEELPYQAFLQTATWAMRYFEEKYGLPVESSLSFEERRKLIEEKLNNRGTMNPETIKAIAENASGRKCDVEELVDDYTFWITIFQGDKSFSFSDFLEKINSSKPSHLSYGITMDFSAQMVIAIACVIKEYKKVRAEEYTGGDPLAGITWYVDENEIILSDEDGNILVE